MIETDTILNKMSPTHRKAFMVLKFLFILVFWQNRYHIKTAVLNHHETCIDETENCAKYVMKILRELQHAYYCHVLKAFNMNINLIAERLYSGFSQDFRLVYQMKMEEYEHVVTSIMTFLSENFGHMKNSNRLCVGFYGEKS